MSGPLGRHGACAVASGGPAFCEPSDDSCTALKVCLTSVVGRRGHRSGFAGTRICEVVSDERVLKSPWVESGQGPGVCAETLNGVTSRGPGSCSRHHCALRQVPAVL